jgi:hypothetical protein
MEQPGRTYNFKTLGMVYAGLVILAAMMVVLFILPMEKLPIPWLDLHLTKQLLIFGDAVIMAGIIAAFPMGLINDKTRINAVILLASLALLFVFMFFVLADIASRGAMDPAFTRQINWKSPVNAADSTGEVPAP